MSSDQNKYAADWEIPSRMSMERALELDGEKLLRLTGEDHGPWTRVVIDPLRSMLPSYSWESPIEPDWAELDDLDERRRVALDIDGGRWESELSAADQDKLIISLAMHSRMLAPACAIVADTISIVQSSTESRADFVRRIVMAVLDEATT